LDYPPSFERLRDSLKEFLIKELIFYSMFYSVLSFQWSSVMTNLVVSSSFILSYVYDSERRCAWVGMVGGDE
jgi:hypothetical protein